MPYTKPILLGTVYRPPNSKADYLDNLDKIFQNSTSHFDDVVVVGDFNVDISKRGNAKKIKTISSHCNMQQLINDYTRITDKTKTIIDFVFVSKPEKICLSGVHSLGLSDHNLIYIIRKNKKVKVPPKIIKSRCFKNFNEHEFIRTLKKTNWDEVLKDGNNNTKSGTLQI